MTGNCTLFEKAREKVHRCPRLKVVPTVDVNKNKTPEVKNYPMQPLECKCVRSEGSNIWPLDYREGCRPNHPTSFNSKG